MTIRPLVRALVVGGHGPFVEDRLRENLKKHGINIVHHWDYALRRAPDLPADIDVMYICTDCVSHPLSAAAVSAAKKRGLRILNGGRKWASTAQFLRLSGFPDRQPSSVNPETIPENIPSTLSAQPAHPETQETMPPVTFPEPKVSTDLVPYIRLLCKQPTITNADMFARLLKEMPGFRFADKNVQKARSHLKIRVGYSVKRGIFTEVSDPEHLQAVADSLGITAEAAPVPEPPAPAAPVPVPVPEPPAAPVPVIEEAEEAVIIKQTRVRPSIPKPAPPKKEKVTMPPVAPVTKVAAPTTKPAAAPVVAPAPVAAPVEEVRPAVNVSPVKLTMKALIDEMRAKMLLFDIEEITITQTTAPAKLRATVDLG
jgi:hypothetical protein